MAIERYGSKSDAFIKLILVFFISLLSFSIGTYVGKKYSDNSHRIAKLEPHGEATASHAAEGDEHEGERDPASIDPTGHEPETKKALSAHEITAIAEEFIADEDSVEVAKKDDAHSAGHAAGHESTKPAAPAVAAAPKAEHAEEASHSVAAAPKPEEEVKKPEAAPSHEAKPAPVVAKPKSVLSPVAQKIIEDAKNEVEDRKPSAIPEKMATVVRGKFTVQVGSFNNEKDAMAKAAELKKENLSAFYTSAQIRGQPWYRVAVGLFNTSQEAQSFLADLKQKQIISSSAFVQKVQ